MPRLKKEEGGESTRRRFLQVPGEEEKEQLMEMNELTLEDIKLGGGGESYVTPPSISLPDPFPIVT